MKTDTVEIIRWKNKVLIYIIKDLQPDKTTFITPKESNLQVGFVVYPKNSEIPRHVHKPIIRTLDRTEEVLVVRKGQCRLDIYNQEKVFITSRTVRKGDIIILVGGGHGFMVEHDTILMEIKQGPYTGIEEKERF